MNWALGLMRRAAFVSLSVVTADWLLVDSCIRKIVITLRRTAWEQMQIAQEIFWVFVLLYAAANIWDKEEYGSL